MKKKKADYRVKIMGRYSIVIAVAVAIGLFVIGRVCYMTFVKADYWEAVSHRFVRDSVPIEALRGDILSADGRVLATSLPEYRMYIDYIVVEKDSANRVKYQAHRDSIILADSLQVIPGLLNKKKQPIPEAVQRQHIDSCRRVLTAICEGMHKIFPDVDPAEFRQHLIKGRHDKKKRHWELYPKKVDYIKYAAVQQLPYFEKGSNYSGFHSKRYFSRKNPYGHLAARTIGDLYGEKDSARSGLELYYDSLLRGTPGYCHRQKILNKYVPIHDKEPENGLNIRTTIDVEMQDLVEEALGDQLRSIQADFGVCILMETATGDIKAMSSLDRLVDGSYKEVSNRAVSLLMEPGSVFKTVSFMVGIDDGAFNMNTMVETGNGVYPMYGRKMRDSNWRRGGHGYIPAHEVLEVSSNIGTSRLIDQYYHDKPDKYVEGVYRTGIHDDLQLPLKGYATPHIRKPYRVANGKRWDDSWSNTALPWMSIGYETQVPPISTLAFYNGIANGGKMVAPRFVTSMERGHEVVDSIPVRVIREQMCKPSTIKDLHEALLNTVEKGTAKMARSKHFHVSGKTGTAQIWTNQGNTSKYFVSFVGYFPSEAPKYSMIVCVKKSAPAYGGTHCCPVFKKVAEGVMASKRETNLKAARDTVHAHKPVVRPGNVASARSGMQRLGNDNTPAGGDAQWSKLHKEGNRSEVVADNTAANQMPDLTGYGLRDAVLRLERMGVKVSASGYGSVASQSVKAGAPIKRGMKVKLVLSKDGKVPEPTTVQADSTAKTGEGAAPYAPADPGTAATPATTSTTPATNSNQPQQPKQ